TRVVGGKPALANEFPNCVLVKGQGPGDFFCSAVLVADRLVLTAGHCGDKHDPKAVVFCTNTGDPQASVSEVEAVERHPAYSISNDYINDVMLLVLREKVSALIEPAKIAPSNIFVAAQFRTV